MDVLIGRESFEEYARYGIWPGLHTIRRFPESARLATYAVVDGDGYLVPVSRLWYSPEGVTGSNLASLAGTLGEPLIEHLAELVFSGLVDS